MTVFFIAFALLSGVMIGNQTSKQPEVIVAPTVSIAGPVQTIQDDMIIQNLT